MHKYIENESKELRRIIGRCGVTDREAGQLTAYFHHLEKHKGIAFLVDFLKTTRNRILNRDVSLKLSGSGKIITKLLDGSRRGLRLALRICNLYGRWEAPPPTRGLYYQFSQKVALKPQNHFPQILDLSESQEKRLLTAALVSNVDYSPLECNSVHIMAGNKKFTGPPDPEKELYALTDAGQVYLDFERYITSIFRPVPEIIRHRLRTLAAEKSSAGVSLVGRISCLTKDRGLKYRFIANLAKGWQVGISPLAKALKLWLHKEGMSALENQLGAVDWMVEELRAGKRISSVDLHQATDFLPFYLFKDSLISFISKYGGSLKDRPFLNACLLDMSLGDSSYYTPYNNMYVQYGTGQAMGRWTSKYQLDYTMILLAQSVGATADNCRVNGDDIIFSDTKVAEGFINLLELLKVPISSSKTFLNETFGEFSGVIADRYGSYDLYKADKIKVKTDPLGPLRRYGPTAIRLLPKEIQEDVWIVACLPEPYGVQSVRELSGDPFKGILLDKGRILQNLLEIDPGWIGDAFMDKPVLDRTEDGRPTNPIASFFDVLGPEVESAYSKIGYRRHRAPLWRMRLLIDNLNSPKVKCSDGHYIDGYGNSDLGRLYEEIQNREIQLVLNKDSTANKPVHPKLRWVRKIARKIKRRYNFRL